MLDYIRSNAQSFGVKLAFGLIILVFVFWGVGSFTDTAPANLVARVNGEGISAQQFEQAYYNAEERILRSNPGLTREALESQKKLLGQQVLRDLVLQSLLRQEAKRLGFSVSPQELRLAVQQMPAFQDASGKFDAAAYKRVLEAQRLTPAQFERDLSQQLLQDKLFAVLAGPAWVEPGEARIRHDFLRERRAVDYIFVPAADFSKDVSIPEADVKTWYEGHQQEFAVPARVDLEYVRISPLALVKAESIDPAAVKARYEADKARYQVPRAVKAAHILVPLAENASAEEEAKAREAMAAIQAELKAGKDFASVADAHNGPNAAGPGGELGWVEPGMTVEPFEKAAFALAAGQLSEPVRSQFGLHIIKVEEIREEGTKPLAEVEDKVRHQLAEEQGSEKLQDALDALIADNIMGKPLAASATRFGLAVSQSGLLSEQELVEKLGLKPEGAAAVLAAGESPIDTALESGESYLVVRVSKTEAASVRPLEAVRDEIVRRLVAEASLKAAMQKAADIRKDLQDGPLPDGSMAKWGIKSVPSVEREAPLGDFLPDAALSRAIFTARPETWLPVAYAVTMQKDGQKAAQGALLCRVAAILPSDSEQWDMVRDLMTKAVESERAEGLTRLFIQDVFARARVEVLNPDQVDRVNM